MFHYLESADFVGTKHSLTAIGGIRGGVRLPQQFQQPEPPSKISTFMDKAVWPIVVTVVGSSVAAVIGAVWLGSIHILNFNWLMLVLGVIMVFLTFFFAWYSHRTRVLLQSKYNNDIAALRKEFYALQQNFIDMANNEFNRLNSWSTDYTLKNAEAQNERFEEMKKQLTEKIMDAKSEMDISIKNAQNIFSGSVKSYETAVDLYKKQVIQTVKRMDVLEEQLRKNSSPES